jgi:hypothetical protein
MVLISVIVAVPAMRFTLLANLHLPALVVHPLNSWYNLGHLPQEVPHGLTRSFDEC